jgi:hypothetical protein
MPLYFLLHDARAFQDEMAPVLAECWRRRSFDPGRDFFARLAAAAAEFAHRYHTGADEPLAAKAADLPFRRDIWRHLTGEALFFGAAVIPELEVDADAYLRLLAPLAARATDTPRGQFAPIQQALFGSRDLCFGGGYYRPEAAGWNDLADVAHLTAALSAIDPERWTVAELAADRLDLSAEDAADELAFAREWFPALADLYRQSLAAVRVVVCEQLG